MPAAENTATPKKRKEQAPAPPVSGTTRRIVLTGAVIALVCAEAWSAPTLFALAEMAKSPRTLAWLLPAVLDTYAATSIWFGNNVPKDHPAHRSAISNTRRALLITVSANGVFHLLTLAGKTLPSWVPIALLIVVMALPIYIADRLVHLYVLASGSGVAVATPVASRPATVAERPTTVAPPATATGYEVAPRVAAPVAAHVAPPRPATAHGNQAAGNGNPTATLIPRDEQLRIVRELVAVHGPEVPLALITERVGGHKSKASRLRAAVLEDSDEDPERAWAVS